MAYTAVYTTATIVRARAKNIGTTPNPTDLMIDEYIGQAECLIDNIMGFSLLKSFDEKKHGIIKMVCTDIATFYAIAHDPSGFDSPSEAALILDIIYTNMLRGLTFLKDERIQKSLKEA